MLRGCKAVNVYLTQRHYGFSNGYTLSVTAVQNIGVATLRNEIGQEVLTLQVPKLTESKAILKVVENTVRARLNPKNESLVYIVNGAMIDGVYMDLQAIVNPYKQSAHAHIEVRLYKNPQELLHMQVFPEVSFTSYKSIVSSVEEAVYKLNKEEIRKKNFEINNVVKFIRRILYFNKGKYRVEVNKGIVLWNTEADIKAYDTETGNMIFNIPTPDVNFYERQQVVDVVRNQFKNLKIDVTLTYEETEYFHREWGCFRVSPKNGSVTIKHTGLFNVEKDFRVSYNDYSEIIQCINSMIAEINRNPLKYTEDNKIGDFHDIFPKNIRNAKMQQKIKNMEEALHKPGQAIKSLFNKQ